MKKRSLWLLSIFLFLSSCSSLKENPEEGKYSLNMNREYTVVDCLPFGEGRKASVFLLLGQSNASGCSYVEYLEKTAKGKDFLRYQNGYDSVMIDFCIDNHATSSEGRFQKVDLTCAYEGCFGPEVGFADKLVQAGIQEPIFILKYTMSGYSLNYNWLRKGSRGDIYTAMEQYAKTYLSYLESKGYEITLDGVLWMQGESDTTEFKASKYLDNTRKFVSYLREDFKAYQSEEGIYFIDAGISDSPYCLPSYPEINEAKVAFSNESDLNLYFPTIENGLTTLNEPYGDPDLGHYDALDEIRLGELFGEAALTFLRS